MPSASARSASRAAFLAASRAPLARIFAPMIGPPQMTSRDLVLMAHYSVSRWPRQSARVGDGTALRPQRSVNM
jgi:hypothetical protein